MTREPAPPEALRGPLRWALLSAGCVACVLGAVGAFLPLLPTTPFLLLAAACFARTSPRFHRALLANRVFGPYLRQWRHDRTIPREAKVRAYVLVVATFAVSILVLDRNDLRVLLIVLACALLVFLASLPTTRRTPGREPLGE